MVRNTHQLSRKQSVCRLLRVLSDYNELKSLQTSDLNGEYRQQDWPARYGKTGVNYCGICDKSLKMTADYAN